MAIAYDMRDGASLDRMKRRCQRGRHSHFATPPLLVLRLPLQRCEDDQLRLMLLMLSRGRSLSNFTARR